MQKSARHFFALALFFSFGLSRARAEAEISTAPVAGSGDIVLEMGSGAIDESLGFGWSRPENRDGIAYRWISHLEADVYVDLPATAPMDFWIQAAPYYLSWKQQNIGLYANGKFVDELVCPADSEFHAYRFVIPADVLKEGRNTLTLRMGYRYRAPRDKRELSLRVQQVLLRAR